jgi:glutamate carboxypeptidase
METLLDFARALVELESPSDHKPSVDRCAEFLADQLSPVASVRVLRARDYGNHVRAEFRLPGRRKEGQILLLGHHDTVYPVGTLQHTPFRVDSGRARGPGIFDMKGGIAIALFAVRALREQDRPVSRRVVLQLNSDEEIGSPSSRPLTEAEARKSNVVLVLEPSAGLEGAVKTGRKGVGSYTLRVRGRASHAGLDFEAGASAILELSRQLLRAAEFTDLPRGITVSPGVISGGTRVNVVPEDAQAEIDIRIARLSDAARLEKRFRSLRPIDRRCTLTVEGGLNRPPLERTRDVIRLYRHARSLAQELGVELPETQVGGGSDGNFTAALGIPTLDGLGAIGEGAHSPGECILLDRLPDRVALMARLLETL